MINDLVVIGIYGFIALIFMICAYYFGKFLLYMKEDYELEEEESE